VISGENLATTSPAPRAACAPSVVPPAASIAMSSASSPEVSGADEGFTGCVAHALAEAVSIDGTFRDLVSSLPESVRPVLGGLPHRLGLTSSEDGQFGDFVTLHPNRELPVYAAADAAGIGGLSPERVASFQRAHHLAAFYWLVRDRLADGQVAENDTLAQAGELLRRRWVDNLTVATDDDGMALALVEEVTADWQRGVRGEKESLRRGITTPGMHGRMVVDKLRWISSASVALLVDGGQRERAHLFRRAYDLFALSLQCIDDVNDQKEDQALYGSSVPAALGCSGGVMVRAAPKLAARAAAVAAEGGFARFATWLGVFARALGTWRPEGNPVADELDAIALAGELDGDAA
jgi:hypothetical protein